MRVASGLTTGSRRWFFKPFRRRRWRGVGPSAAGGMLTDSNDWADDDAVAICVPDEFDVNLLLNFRLDVFGGPGRAERNR